MTIFDWGEYGIYIWPAFLVTFVVMGGLAVQSVVLCRKFQRKATDLEQMLGGRKRPAARPV